MAPTSATAKKQPISRPADLNFKLPLPEPAVSDTECRSRISQFIILPPFQGGGHGSRFYNAIFDHYLAAPDTIEITVEDPNEAFDDLRDLNDLTRLRADPEFMKTRINTDVTLKRQFRLPAGKIVDRDALEKIRVTKKIATRQFYRLVEMQLLSLIPTSIRQSLLLEGRKGDSAELKQKEREYYLWQLLTKQRLYKHNKEQLMQIDRAERIDSLEQTLGGVEADYARLLRALDGRQDGKGSNGGAGANGKRPAPEEMEKAEPSTKKARTRD